jgi:hypothetical protein
MCARSVATCSMVWVVFDAILGNRAALKCSRGVSVPQAAAGAGAGAPYEGSGGVSRMGSATEVPRCRDLAAIWRAVAIPLRDAASAMIGCGVQKRQDICSMYRTCERCAATILRRPDDFAFADVL